MNILNLVVALVVIVGTYYMFRLMFYFARYGVFDPDIDRLVQIVKDQKKWREDSSTSSLESEDRSILWVSESNDDIQINWRIEVSYEDGDVGEVIEVSPGKTVAGGIFHFENNHLIRYKPECGFEIEGDALTVHHKRSAYRLLSAVHRLVKASG
jgi:hypothetical protein